MQHQEEPLNTLESGQVETTAGAASGEQISEVEETQMPENVSDELITSTETSVEVPVEDMGFVDKETEEGLNEKSAEFEVDSTVEVESIAVKSEEVQQEDVGSSKDDVVADVAAESAILETLKADEAVDHEEESTETVHDELAPQVAFQELSRIELVSAMQGLLSQEDAVNQKLKFMAIREAYAKVKEDEVAGKRLKYIENGGEREAFEVQRDETDDKFDGLVKQFQEKRADFRRKKEQELQTNLKLKQGILNELKQLMEKTENISASFDRLHELQAEWRNIGLVPASYVDELWKIYHHHINNFYDVIKINKELRELDHKKNLELKTALCVKAEELILENSITHSLDVYKQLQDQWKDVGQVAREFSDTLWDRFRSAGDKLFDRRRVFVQGQEKDHKENLDKKTAVCEKAEALLAEIPYSNHIKWQAASDKLAALLEEWKEIGFASRRDNETVWKRFKTSRDRFYEAKEEYYKGIRQTQNHNYKLKVDLCMEVEALKEQTDWKKTGERIRQLQEQWKTTGPVAKKHSDKLWERFKKACDVFYESRNAHFAGMNDEQDSNLERKRELIGRINAFEQGENNNANFEILKGFQAEWLETGHVPIKEKDTIYKEFRASIDKQFAKLKAEGTGQRRDHFREQVATLNSNPAGKDKLNHQRIGVQDKIKRLQTEMQTLENNIGFFKNSKSAAAEEMKRDTEKKINKAKEEISELKEQLKVLRDA